MLLLSVWILRSLKGWTTCSKHEALDAALVESIALLDDPKVNAD